MIMLAFAVLMSGMQTMSGAMAPLKTSPWFLNFISAVSNIDLVYKFDHEAFETVEKRENLVDTLEDRVGDYLVMLNAKELGDEETRTSPMYLTNLGNVERISGHAMNIAELSRELQGKKTAFSHEAQRELEYCFGAAKEIVGLTLRPEDPEDGTLTHRITALEEVMDVLTRDMKTGHIHRVQSGNCTLELGFIFNDLLNNLERVSDHCANIAIAAEESKEAAVNAHEYMNTLNPKDRQEYRTQLHAYLKKYCVGSQSIAEK